MAAAKMTHSVSCGLSLRFPQDFGGEKGTGTENRGIAFQSRDSEEFPGRVSAEKKVQDKPNSFGQPYIKGKMRSPGKGGGLEDMVLDAKQRESREKEWRSVIESGFCGWRRQKPDGNSLRSEEILKQRKQLKVACGAFRLRWTDPLT